MASGSSSNYVMCWLYYDGNIINNNVIGYTYDRNPIRFVKLLFNLKFRGLLDLLYAKLFIDPNLYKLKVLRRVMNCTTNKFGVAPIVDDDDVDYMFESLDGSGSKVHVELYVEKVSIDLAQNSVTMVEGSTIGESSENTSTSHNSKGVKWGENISSGSSNRSLYMSRVDSEGNSRGTSEVGDDDIPYYRSFDGSSMVISYQEPVMKNVGDLHSPTELTKGMVFKTKDELLEVVKRVHIVHHQEFKVVRSDPLSWDLECKLATTGCPWKLRARKRATHSCFEIMYTRGPHTCLNQSISQDHHNLNASNIAQNITSLIAADPSVSDKVLESTILKEFGYTPSKKKVRDARRIATSIVYGSWEQSYQKLPLFLNALQISNHGTRVEWYFKEHDLGQPISEVVTFKRVFWTFQPCIDAFAHCIPVLQIDGTHLYGKYKGVLLTATAVDGFYHILPVAFAIVEGESIGSWTWFMERVRRIVAPTRTGVCVISDRHAGIISAMNNPAIGLCEPLGHHRFCVRHLAANFATKFKKMHLKDRVVTMCSQLTVAKSSLHWNALLAVEPRADEWFSEINPMQSSLAFDGGKRYGIMTTNMAESWNNAIKASRKLPITALVTSLFYKVVSYFDQRRLEIEKQSLNGNEFTKHANQILNKWIKRASGHHVILFDRNALVFEVTTMKRGQKGGNKQTVQLRDHICTCNKWQTYHIPCSHVLACCASAGMQYTSFIDDCYKLENARKVYAGQFHPIQKESDWPLLTNFPLVMHDDENTTTKKAGRRKETRYKNEMDYQALKKGKKASCGGVSSSVP